MSREPILIGLDDSPIVIQVKDVEWAFDPDPQPDFLIKMMEVAKTLQEGDFSDYPKVSGLLEGQLVKPAQRKKWNETAYGFSVTTAVLTAYIEEVARLPIQPS